jgi:class 3 adenylate cyclase
MKFIQIFLLLIPVFGFSQNYQPNSKDLLWADSVYHAIKSKGDSIDLTSRLEQCNKLSEIWTASTDYCKLAQVFAWKSHVYDEFGSLDSAMAAIQRARHLYQANCDSLIYMSIEVLYTSLLLSLNDLDEVIERSDAAIKIWNRNWAYSNTLDSFYSNKAIAHALKGNSEIALQSFREQLLNAQKEEIFANELRALANLGAMFGMMSNESKNTAFLDSSSHYLHKALNLEKIRGTKNGELTQYLNLGVNAKDRKMYQRGLAFADTTEKLAIQLKNRSHLISSLMLKSECYRALNKNDSAYHYLRLHLSHNDTLLNEAKVKAVTEMQEKYESEKKARTIKELELSKLASEIKETNLRRTRNGFMGGFALVALFALVFFFQRNKISKEKARSEELLLNILPEEVAEELKAKGEAEAQLIQQVTVLFTDFKGFTAMSEILSPKALVADIHESFSAFDHIMDKYNIEKIKTIGDAYMAAGGLPTPNTTHASDVVQAALEIRAFIEAGKDRKKAAGLPYFEIRIGIHTGPVVAGIVGVKKFQYDIWGDTVNTASRLESSGEISQINISETTYNLLKDLPNFAFESRGKIQAKGKGEMEMYFVSKKN